MDKMEKYENLQRVNELSSLHFGDEIEPVTSHVDNKKRRFIFMNWMAGNVSGYANIATLVEDGAGFDEYGRWIENYGLVLECTTIIHKSVIKPKQKETK